MVIRKRLWRAPQRDSRAIGGHAGMMRARRRSAGQCGLTWAALMAWGDDDEAAAAISRSTAVKLGAANSGVAGWVAVQGEEALGAEASRSGDRLQLPARAAPAGGRQGFGQHSGCGGCGQRRDGPEAGRRRQIGQQAARQATATSGRPLASEAREEGRNDAHPQRAVGVDLGSDAPSSKISAPAAFASSRAAMSRPDRPRGSMPNGGESRVAEGPWAVSRQHAAAAVNGGSGDGGGRDCARRREATVRRWAEGDQRVAEAFTRRWDVGDGGSTTGGRGRAG